MRTIKRLLYVVIILGGAYVTLEVSKRLSRTTPEILMKENLENLQEANNLPDVIFNNKEYFRWQPNNKCAKLPQLYEIVTNNIYWQVLPLQKINKQRDDYYLFGAYFDSRGPDIKILAMAVGTPSTLYCNIWFDQGIEPKTVQATHHYVWNKTWKRKPYLLNPYLYSCKLTDNFVINKNSLEPVVPKAVSLIEEPCHKATNLLKVNHDDNEAKKEFMVCVKGLDFPEDISYKLIEWIELIRLLGANMIHFYILNVHENVAKVLDHYKQVGWIITEGLSIPGHAATPGGHYTYYNSRKNKSRPQQKRHELIPYNDCFYKHRESYKYVILLDVDEIIMPNIGNWKDLIQKLQNNTNSVTSTFSVPNAYFLDELAETQHVLDRIDEHNVKWPVNLPDSFLSHNHNNIPMLRRVYRTRNMTQPSLFIKGFHNTSDVVALHNHFPIECVQDGGAGCVETKIHPDDAKLAHYRTCPDVLGAKCVDLKRDYVRDDTILRFQDELLQNVADSLHVIGL